MLFTYPSRPETFCRSIRVNDVLLFTERSNKFDNNDESLNSVDRYYAFIIIKYFFLFKYKLQQI